MEAIFFSFDHHFRHKIMSSAQMTPPQLEKEKHAEVELSYLLSILMFIPITVVEKKKEIVRPSPELLFLRIFGAFLCIHWYNSFN